MTDKAMKERAEHLQRRGECDGIPGTIDKLLERTTLQWPLSASRVGAHRRARGGKLDRCQRVAAPGLGRAGRLRSPSLVAHELQRFPQRGARDLHQAIEG